jgi:hypothetical protein
VVAGDLGHGRTEALVVMDFENVDLALVAGTFGDVGQAELMG